MSTKPRDGASAPTLKSAKPPPLPKKKFDPYGMGLAHPMALLHCQTRIRTQIRRVFPSATIVTC